MEQCFCKVDCRQKAEVDIPVTACCKEENAVGRQLRLVSFYFMEKKGPPSCSTAPQDVVPVLMLEGHAPEEAADATRSRTCCHFPKVSHSDRFVPFCTQNFRKLFSQVETTKAKFTACKLLPHIFLPYVILVFPLPFVVPQELTVTVLKKPQPSHNYQMKHLLQSIQPYLQVL